MTLHLKNSQSCVTGVLRALGCHRAPGLFRALTISQGASWDITAGAGAAVTMALWQWHSPSLMRCFHLILPLQVGKMVAQL